MKRNAHDGILRGVHQCLNDQGPKFLDEERVKFDASNAVYLGERVKIKFG